MLMSSTAIRDVFPQFGKFSKRSAQIDPLFCPKPECVNFAFELDPFS